jgi:enolase-phosphatase E1
MIKAIITDIEGTTSSLSFVKDVLFPYAREHIEEYVREHCTEDPIETLVDDVRQEVGRELSLDEVIVQLIEWIDQDRKVTPLKSIQGLLWESGYKNGDFKGHIYADAKHKLEEWHKQGIKLYVYSSGSVYAQKLLFGYTDYGDLNPLFDGYFDTNIGGKTETESYQRIVNELGLKADEILFLSDVEAELDAARAAGMQTQCLVRSGEISSDAGHATVKSFDNIRFDSNS